MAAASPHGPAPTTTASTTAGWDPVSPLPSSISRADDLVAPCPDADVAYRRFRQGLDPVQVPPGRRRQVLELARRPRRRLPAVEPLVLRLHTVQRRDIG